MILLIWRLSALLFINEYNLFWTDIPTARIIKMAKEKEFFTLKSLDKKPNGSIAIVSIVKFIFSYLEVGSESLLSVV